ncbi:Sporulation domain protein [Magnetococcus marinus MC-1]|uniref:Sporulation domain protein n=1 Tax=Magnetococcus marinus (strain ATCC BAA-1437 / JCM 17883 / MC-1) TaxID=156889 RepID=A0LD55_MAGMM|nr:SPOR domain-containing protein [Magnetococcus marinus]ABK45898.1 Sporulation domain protein [Magnetococcus marinus MC-1]
MSAAHLRILPSHTHPRGWRLGYALCLVLLLITGCSPASSVPPLSPVAIKQPPPARTYRLLTLPIQAEDLSERAILQRWLDNIHATRSLEFQPLPAPENWAKIDPTTPQGRERFSWLQADQLLQLKVVKEPLQQVVLKLWLPNQEKPLWSEQISYLNKDDLVLALRLLKRRLHQFLGDAVWIILEPQPTVFLTFPDTMQEIFNRQGQDDAELNSPTYGGDNQPLPGDVELPLFLQEVSTSPNPPTEPEQPLLPAPALPTERAQVSGYTIQVGAFQDRQRAKLLASRLVSLGYSPMLSHYLNRKQETWFFVWMGNYPTREEAVKASETFRSVVGEHPFVTRIHALHKMIAP